MPKTIGKLFFLMNQIIFCMDGFCHKGSAFRNSSGNWNVPYGNWDGDKWKRNGNWPRNDWNSDNRVVLLDNQQMKIKTPYYYEVFLSS